MIYKDDPVASAGDERELERLMRESFRGGRRLPAHILDTLSMALILFLIVYTAARTHMKNASAALFAAIPAFSGAALIWAFIRRELYARHRRKLLSSAEKSAARLKFLLEPERLFDKIKPSDGVFLHRGTDALSADVVAEAARACGGKVTIVTAAPPTEAARELIKLSGGDISIVTPEEHIGKKLCDVYPVTEEERNKAAAAELRGSRRRVKFSQSVFALTKERALKYFSVGAGLYLFSFFVRYAIYYRVIASISLSLGAVVFAESRLKQKAR